MSPQNKIAAIIVAYHPNPESLRRLVSFLVAEGVYAVVVDNGGGQAVWPDGVFPAECKLIDLGGNRGIGTAINRGILEARKYGATYIITFDQDSSPARGMIAMLAGEFQRQVQLGVQVAAVGPKLIDSRQNPPLVHPFVRLGVFGAGHRYCESDSQIVEVDTLITSGCLTSLNVLDVVGQMDPGYFVDYTDVEWCFRAKSKGFVLLGLCKAEMIHELGHGAVRKILCINIIEYSPIRRYYYARNTIQVACRRYISFRWKVRLLFGLCIRACLLFWAPRADGTSAASEYKMLFRGIWDAFRGVRGALNAR